MKKYTFLFSSLSVFGFLGLLIFNINVVTGATNTSPVLSPFGTIPSNTQVGQTVNFTWSATDVNHDDLLWGVNWGDESGATAPTTCSDNPPAGTSQNWIDKEAHSWTSPGNYTVTVYVSDCKSITTRNSFTINITGNGIFPGYYIPPSNTISGTLTPASHSCIIAAGGSSCTVNLTWNTINPPAGFTSTITANGMTNVIGNSGSNVPFTVPYNSRIFSLYNSGTSPIAQSTVTASCVSGTAWDGKTCALCDVVSTPVPTGSVATRTSDNVSGPLPADNTPDLNFPAGCSYTIPNGSGTIVVDFNYAPKVPDVTWAIGPGEIGEPTPNVLGQNYKGFYFHAGGPFFGPVGRYDLSDPFHPQGPNLVQITNNSIIGKGPLNTRGWGHLDVHQRFMFPAEAPDGEARVHFTTNLNIMCTKNTGTNSDCSSGEFPSTSATAVSFPASGPGTFGQQYDPKFLEYFDPVNTPGSGAGIAVATPSSKFFMYSDRGGHSVGIFDMTDLSGSPDVPYLDNLSGTVGWSNVKSLSLIQVPGSDKQILLSNIYLSNIINTNTTIKMGFINPDTGTLSGIKSKDIPYVFGRVPGNIGIAYAAGKVYLLVPQNIGGDWKVDIYSLNTSSLTITKISTVNFKSAGVDINSSFTFWNSKVANASDNQGYPVLIVPVQTTSTALRPNPNPGSAPYQPLHYGYDLNFYNLKNILSQASSTPQPDFVLHQTTPPPENWFGNGSLLSGNLDYDVANGATTTVTPLHKGDVIVPPEERYQAFLKTDAGKTNLYLYRNAFLYAGTHTRRDNPYELYLASSAHSTDPLYDIGSEGMRGVYSLRTDRIDVTSLTGGASGATGNGCAAGNLFNTVTGIRCSSS